MAELGRWSTFSTLPLTGREVVTMPGCSFMRGWTWRSTVHTARSCCPMGLYQLAASFQTWDQNPRATLSCCLCHYTQPIPFRVTDPSNSNGSLAWEAPRALICFTSNFAFSKVACCSEPHPIPARSLLGSIWDGSTMPSGK